MPEMTIRLQCDPNTGQRDIVVGLTDDAELLPHEHEQLHRKLVDKLLEGGLLKDGEGGSLIVERLNKGEAAAQPAAEQPAERASVSEGQ